MGTSTRPRLAAVLIGLMWLACADRLGQTAPPRLTLSPESYAFGTVEVGRRDSVTVRATNVGGSPLVIMALTPRAGASTAYRMVVTDPLPWTLVAGGTRSFEVVFEPATMGRHVADFELATSDSTTPITVFHVEALDNLPRFAVTPTQIDFGTVEPHTTATAEVSMANEGSAGLEVVNARADGNPELTVSPQAYPIALLPTELAALRLQYAPSGCGAHAASVEIVSTDPSAPAIQLTLLGNTPGRGYVLSSSTARFNPLDLGRRSTRPLTLRSRGTQPLTVRGVSLVDEAGQPGGAVDFAIVSAPTNITLQPNATTELQLAFAPTRLGERRAILRIESDDCAGPVRAVPISGTSLANDGTLRCELAFEPTSLDFGGVSTQGGLRDLLATLRVVGSGPCTFTGAEVTTPGESFFEVIAAPSLGTRLNAGDTAPFGVRFKPTRPGDRIGRVFASALDPSRGGTFLQASLAVSGRAGPAVLFIDPQRHDYGATRIGCVSKEATFTLSSIGESDVLPTATAEASAQLVITTPPPLLLVPGTTAPLRARMRPTTAGVVTGHIRVASNDQEEPVRLIGIRGRAVAGPEFVDRFVQPLQPSADLLFVVDNSGSMADEQAALERSFSTFAAEAVRQGGDYRIGVVTTDTPFLRGSPALVRATDANPDATFRRNVRVGLGGSGIERGFLMAALALTPPLSTTSNAGLLRPDVPLELVFVSDEDDQSGGSVDDYLRRFAEVVGPLNRFRVSAIVGPASGCASATGRALPGTRYLAAAAATNGVTGSICDANFGAALTRLGQTTFGARDTIPLSGTPDLSQPVRALSYPNEAACDADPEAAAGTSLPPSAFTYNSASNAIVFSQSALPPRGACVLVRYTLGCITP